MKDIVKLPTYGTTVLDIYEAAGGIVSEDRNSVTLNGQAKPFKIELMVIPTGMETNYDAPDEVTLGVVLADEIMLEGDVMGHRVMAHVFDVTLKLPVSQVKIIKDDS